jgi:hypothetical protein
MTLKHSIESMRRTGATPEERSKHMTNLAKIRISKMSKEERSAHAKLMISKRWKKDL